MPSAGAVTLAVSVAAAAVGVPATAVSDDAWRWHPARSRPTAAGSSQPDREK